MNYKASDIDGSWATNTLHESLKQFNVQSARQTEQMLRLTKIIALLTVVMLFAVGWQIYLAYHPPSATAVGSITQPVASITNSQPSSTLNPEKGSAVPTGDSITPPTKPSK